MCMTRVRSKVSTQRFLFPSLIQDFKIWEAENVGRGPQQFFSEFSSVISRSWELEHLTYKETLSLQR